MMQPVMDVADVVEFEGSLAEKGLKPFELMRRAGAVVALQAARFVESGSVVVLCGMGNNGGDGWVAADSLARHGYEVSVVSAATPAVIKGEAARRHASRAQEMGVPVHVDPSYEDLAALLADADVVVDAVFGTGFKGSLPSPYDMWVRAVDDAFFGTLVAVDVPSGINATTGMSEGPYFDADVTVTMFAAKPGLISGEGRRASGAVVVASLAADEEGLSDLSDAAAAFTLDEADYAGVLPEVDPLCDKYSRGRVLVVTGSARYPGAACMAALAAARAGAGYVTLAVPEPVVPIAQVQLPSVPVVGLPADAEGSFATEAADRVRGLAAKADVVVAGPGLTTSFGACEVVRSLLGSPCALVLDADALNALVKICLGSAEAHPDALRRDFPLVLTPHRRELARLVGADPASCSSLAAAMRTAQSLAWSVGSADFCVVAKGPVSAVATIDGTVVPEPGPASLATAGTGDVLAGVVGSLLAQALAGLDGEEGIGSSDLLMLAAAADRVHALAGSLAAGEYGARGVIAPDVAAKVGLAVDALVERSERAAEEAGEDEGGRLEGDLAFEDESRITPPPEVERLIRADAAAARAAQVPGELRGYRGDLEEPAEPAQRAGQDAPEGAGKGAEAPRADEVPEVAPAAGPTDAGEAEPRPEDAPEDVPAAVAPDVPEPAEVPAADGGSADPAADAGAEAAGAVRDEGPDAPEAESAAPEPEVPADPAPQRPAAAMPPFLARAIASEEPAPPAGEPAAADATTVMAPVAADEPHAAGRSEEGLFAPRELSEAERARRRREAFHERATLHIDDDEVTPVDKRPSAKPRRRRGSSQR